MADDHDLVGIPEASDSEVAEFVERVTKPTRRHVEPETLKLWSDYLREHRERMGTFRDLQREQGMGGYRSRLD